MSDIIKLLLQAEIGKSSIENIKSQLDGLQKNIKPIEIDIEIDKNILQQVQNLNKIFAQNNPTLTPKVDTSQVEKGLARITNHFKDGEDAARQQTKTTVAGYEKTVELLDTINKKSIKKDVTYDFAKEQNDIKKNTEMYTRMFIELEQKEKKSIEAVGSAREKSAERARKENEKAELAQAKAINKAIEDNYKQQVSEEKITKALKERIELYQQKMRGDLDIFANKNKGKYDEAQLEAMRSKLEGLSVAGGGAERSMKELRTEFGHMKQEASQSNTMLAQITENFVKFARFYLVGQQIVNFRNAVKDGVQSVKELDTSLTELNKITSMSEQQMKLFVDRAYDAGVTIARTGKEVVDATVEWRRAGYAMEEAFELAQQSLLLTNVGSGIDDVVEASSSMIAILKGFKMEAEDATHIVNALNEVSNNYAVDTVNLTEILKRVSGSMAQTGTSYEQLIGLSVGAFESLRNSEKVASGKIFCPYVQKCA